MLDWLMHPKVFNVAIMGLYVLAMFWWAWHGKWADAMYWFFALGLTLVVTFGYQR